VLTASDTELDVGNSFYIAMESLTIVGEPAFIVGETTTGNHLDVASTGTVVSCNHMTLGSEEGSSGSVTVDLGASLVVDSTLYVGGSGTGSFTLRDGTVSSANTIVGTNSGSSGQMRVLGGSTWTNTGAFRVSRGTLSIEEASTLSDCSELFVGSATTGSATVTISGGSNLTLTGNITVAKAADSLSLSGGSKITGLGGDTYGQVSLEDSGTVWEMDAELYAQDGSVLTIEDEALVKAGGLLAYSSAAIRLGGGYLALLGDFTADDAEALTYMLGTLYVWNGSAYEEADTLDDLRYTYCTSDADGLAFTGGIYGDLAGYTLIAAVPEPAHAALLSALAALAFLRLRAGRRG
jgi:T5SS/PEP-CTERM-associated repeat protein